MSSSSLQDSMGKVFAKNKKGKQFSSPYNPFNSFSEFNYFIKNYELIIKNSKIFDGGLTAVLYQNAVF